MAEEADGIELLEMDSGDADLGIDVEAPSSPNRVFHDRRRRAEDQGTASLINDEEERDFTDEIECLKGWRKKSKAAFVLLPWLLCVTVACVSLALVIASLGHFKHPVDETVVVVEEGENHITSQELRADLEFLSSDLLEGRGTGSRGEDLAVSYIAAQMKIAGLKPQGTDGYYQKVDLLGSKPSAETSHLRFNKQVCQFPVDYVASTDLREPSVGVSQEGIIFVGFGIAASSEYNWNDYKDGIDYKDKVLVALVNDPEEFEGNTLTYFGRWTYKFEQARRMGAKGIFLIHTNESAGYPYSVIRNGGVGEEVTTDSEISSPLTVKGWIRQEAAELLAKQCGDSLSGWQHLASSRDFQPINCKVNISFRMSFEQRSFQATNVVGVLPGAGSRRDEAVIFTAHHDHLGIGPADSNNDNIYNGAEDNASGVALLLAIARAFAALPYSLGRSIIFLTVTAEEKGLVGSQYYVEHPAWPLKKTLLNINYDMGNVYGKTEDVVGLGIEHFEDLRILFERVAETENMTVSPDPEPEQGHFFRSDQLNFFRNNIPAVMISSGCKYVGQSTGYCSEVRDAYRNNHYHQPSDEYHDTWSMDGMIQMARLGYHLAFALANSTSLQLNGN